MQRGRPVKGAEIVEELDGSEAAKKRMKVILETLSGQRTIMQACLELGIGKSAFHEMRKRVLQAAMVDVEPRPAGRPREEPTAEAAEAERLEAENERLRTDLKIAHVREEILLAMPEVFDPGRKAGKGGARNPPESPRKKGSGTTGRRRSRNSRPSTSRWWSGSCRRDRRRSGNGGAAGGRRNGSGGRWSGR